MSVNEVLDPHHINHGEVTGKGKDKGGAGGTGSSEKAHTRATAQGPSPSPERCAETFGARHG